MRFDVTSDCISSQVQCVEMLDTLDGGDVNYNLRDAPFLRRYLCARRVFEQVLPARLRAPGHYSHNSSLLTEEQFLHVKCHVYENIRWLSTSKNSKRMHSHLFFTIDLNLPYICMSKRGTKGTCCVSASYLFLVSFDIGTRENIRVNRWMPATLRADHLLF